MAAGSPCWSMAALRCSLSWTATSACRPAALSASAEYGKPTGANKPASLKGDQGSDKGRPGRDQLQASLASNSPHITAVVQEAVGAWLGTDATTSVLARLSTTVPGCDPYMLHITNRLMLACHQVTKVSRL